MSDSILPDGFYELKVSGTDSRMWIGPDTLAEPMVVYAYPVGSDVFKAHFTDGSGEANGPRVEFLTAAQLESRAVTHCRELAGVNA